MIDHLDALAQIGLAVGVLVGGVFAGVQSRQSRREAAEAKEQARVAAENSHPIGNGWGTALRSDMAATRQAVERIAEAQLLAERRELRLSAQVDRIDQRLQDHLNETKGTKV